MNTGVQMPLQSIPDFQAEMRDRRYTQSVVALNALVTLRRLADTGEPITARAWNEAWALAYKAVPPPGVATPATPATA